MSNKLRIEEEIIDIKAIVSMLEDNKILSKHGYEKLLMRIKKNKVEEYMKYSKFKGTLDE